VNSDLAAALGRVVRTRRGVLNLTVENIGQRSGLSWKHVGDIERGTKGAGNVQLVTLFKLASALDMTATELVRRIEAAAAEGSTDVCREVRGHDWRTWATMHVGVGVVRAPITYGVWGPG
jgi:transcriptional regulator with XRE-family HTH domain